MLLFDTLDAKVKELGGLIVSCQPVPGSPLDKPEIVAAMAQAAVQAGAVAVRIEGVNNLKAARELISVPIIGIIKRDLPDSPVRITPLLDDVDALAQAGADIIAFDGTERPRPVSVAAIIERIHQQGCAAMADCSSLEDGTQCHLLGAEIIGTTLSGYTTDVVPEAPDFPLVRALSAKGYRVIAEGRFNSPALAAQAIQHGAWAVTVGSAITRLEHICQWYRDALAGAAV
ncbi:N-acetylmannosamine-6-phosphate 2-epimerase [Mixta tenebrionis]|uniref:Putative N-acetylmannosamine-6-phosphate 2-epimerase n=1 Tax=Mixta tenebrionis TaxID=2562439 RepID=A0A506V7V3_9GAMM|nr:MULTISPECIES: N-acetylmannosamine-6-phosphate 2-epimerase [Mixta]QHM77381.1 Putative N-acetylmannosamine-6-phosphate 2-epimerase 2 [Mixta theicola]TPW41901.1 N-acetylmannosamine-6-phosphate 2-epimerase [Mixta tenebrionis]